MIRGLRLATAGGGVDVERAMRVAVCVITYQRPQGLRRLLDGLNRLTFTGEPPGIRCIVVDNDEAESARAVCDEVRPGFRWKLESYVEPRRGIPQARNAAVARGCGGADSLAFIDDDEVPEPGWLDELLRVQERYDADVVAGPVLPKFVDPVPDWIVTGRFFDRPRRATGHRLTHVFTGNVLVRSELFWAQGLLFDERFALTGGEDHHFFRRVHRAGFRIVWANDAVVREWIPRSRANAAWLVRRAYRTGCTSTTVKLDLTPLLATRGLIVVKGIVWLVIGAWQCLTGLLRGRHARVEGARSAAYGAGLLAGAAGRRFEEYQTTHRV